MHIKTFHVFLDASHQGVSITDVLTLGANPDQTKLNLDWSNQDVLAQLLLLFGVPNGPRLSRRSIAIPDEASESDCHSCHFSTKADAAARSSSSHYGPERKEILVGKLLTPSRPLGGIC